MCSPDRRNDPAAVNQESAVSDAIAVNQDGDLARTLDTLSLTQALLDFEVANARVLDLTARLVEANQRVQRSQAEIDAARAEAATVQSDAVASIEAAHGETDRVRAELQATMGQTRAELVAALAEVAAIRATRGYRALERVAKLRRALRG
jgi:hypothetical protein